MVPQSGLSTRRSDQFATPARRRTILLSTHLFQEVDAMADRVLLVDNGRLAFDGTPEEFKKRGKGHMDQAFHSLTTHN